MKKRCFIILYFILFSLFIGTSCTTNNDINNESVTTPYIALNIQGNSVVLDMSADRYCQEVTMMTTEFPMDFTLGEYEGWDITIDDIPVHSGEATKIQVTELDKDIAVVIQYRNIYTGETGEQYIRTLPNAVRDYTVLSHVDNGVYYYAHDGYALKMDHNGKIIFYYADANSSGKYLNEFKKVEKGNRIYYLITALHNSHQWPALGSGAGPNAKEIILDEQYYPVTTVECLYQTNRTPAGIPLDQHEFLMLDENHYVLCGYVPVRAENIPDTIPHSAFGARVVAAVIQEVKNEEVIFEWYSTDYPELYGYSVEQNDFFNETNAWSDYAHLNSIDVDETDENFICSFRHLDTMLKIDRNSGEIIWSLSGNGDQFGLTDAQKTSRQHDFRKIGKNTYSVFDNGYNSQQTRIVEYTLDETNMSLLDFKEYYLEKCFSPYQGNAQKITDARYVFSGGMWTNNSNALFYDVDFKTQQILFEAVPVSNNQGYDMVYRAYRYDA